MKRFITIILTLAMVLGLAACSNKQSTATEEPDEEQETVGTDATEEELTSLDGGWELVRGDAAALPEDVQAAFDKATAEFTGSDLKPVAYVAYQVVSGRNYMVLCEATTVTQDPVTSYQMLVIYADLNGNATLTTLKDFDLTAYTQDDGQPVGGLQRLHVELHRGVLHPRRAQREGLQFAVVCG